MRKQSLRVLCGFVRDFFMIPHRGTEMRKQSLRVLCGFVRDFFKRHRDHREKQSLRVLCGFVWDIGLRPSLNPL
ncbi:MAG: hypothetical protein B6245_00485 [Desulfobacteraceae bacterium 4572_88]|nr:MAG: hypothetical protein B6245_00485 [Desulfobacteraceae bacterium 4572_88]